MNNVNILINDKPVGVSGLYYISNNNYYFIYTDGEIDQNGFVVLHIVKVLQEVMNTSNGPQPTGYLVGTTISNDEEYTQVKQDIAHIIDDKQNNKEGSVYYLDTEMLSKLRIRDTKVFRLKQDVYNKVFGNIESVNQSVSTTDTNGNIDYQTKYNEEVTKNKELMAKIESLNNKLNSIKDMLE